MKTQKRLILAPAVIALTIAIFFVMSPTVRAVKAQDGSQAGPQASVSGPTPGSPNVLAGEANAKQLLLLMDTDKSGKISKQEFMAYMEAEFDRLDVNKDGELDVKELTKPKPRSVAGGHK